MFQSGIEYNGYMMKVNGNDENKSNEWEKNRKHLMDGRECDRPAVGKTEQDKINVRFNCSFICKNIQKRKNIQFTCLLIINFLTVLKTLIDL